MKSIPDGFALTRTTPVFDSTTVPAKMLGEHRTAVGTWGRITVVTGVVSYRILGAVTEEHALMPGAPGIIEPDRPHQISPAPGAQFYVELFRDVTTG